MPASPFGLAYGLGAGMSNIPQAYTQGQQQGMSLAMQNLQLQEMARQANETKRMNEVLSNPIAAPKDTVDVYGDVSNPEYQKQLQAQQDYDKLAKENPGHPVLSGMARPDVSEPETFRQKTGEAQKTHVWITPQEQLAYEYSQRANMLRQAGLGRSAFQLDQQAAQYAAMHRDQALRMAGQSMIGANPNAAIPYLKSAGINVDNIRQDPSDEDNFIVTRSDNGRTYEASVPKTMAMMVGADPTKAAEVLGTIQWRNAQYDLRNRQLNINQQKANDLRDYHKEIADYRKQSSNKPTAAIMNARALAQSSGMSFGDALKLWSPGGGKSHLTPNQEISIRQKANKDLYDKYGRVPVVPPGSPSTWTDAQKEQAEFAKAYAENSSAIGGLLSSASSKPGNNTPPPANTPPPPPGFSVK